MSLVFKTLRWGALLCSLILLTTAFIPSAKASSKDLSCTVEVRNADGSAANMPKYLPMCQVACSVLADVLLRRMLMAK